MASNISRCVKYGKISGLKTHGCHVILQRLLPVGIRPQLHKDVCDAIVGLSRFLEQICAKTLKVKDLDRRQKEIVVVLCKLEQIFHWPSLMLWCTWLCIYRWRQNLVDLLCIVGCTRYRGKLILFIPWFLAILLRIFVCLLTYSYLCISQEVRRIKTLCT